MKRVALDSGYDEEYVLVGITTQQKNYRVAWLMNNRLHMGFERKDDIVFYFQEKPLAGFARFDYTDELNRLSYHLIENKDETLYLLPELKNIDFLIVIKGALEYFEPDRLIKALSGINELLFVTAIDPKQLKSRHNLIIPEIQY